MLARAAGMATCCELNYSETTYGSNLAIHLVFRAEACKVNRDHHPFLKRKGLYLQSYLKDQHAHQMCCGWTSVEAGIFRHGEEGQQSVCINPTAPEVKHCLSRSAPHSRGLLELSSLSQKSLTSASSHPLPTHPLHHTLSPLPTIYGCTTGKAEGRRLKKENCCHRKEQGKPRWDQVYNIAVANRYKCDCPGTTRQE